MSGDIVPQQQAAPPATRAAEIQPVPVEQIIGRIKAVEQVVSEVMVEGVHWGDVPGVQGQKMIDKPGVEVLAATFQLALDYVVDASTTPDGELRYIVKCRVLQQGTEAYLGSGMGEASTAETKYMWRGASREEYEATGEDRRRLKTKTYQDSGRTVETYQVRENNVDKANTAIKQACTRAARDAVLGVLGVRGMVLQGNRQQAQTRSQERRTQAQRGGQDTASTAATEAQKKRIRGDVRTAGIADAMLAAVLEQRYGAAGVDQLTKQQASDLIQRPISPEEQAAAAGVDPVTGEVPGDDDGDYWPEDEGAPS